MEEVLEGYIEWDYGPAPEPVIEESAEETPEGEKAAEGK